jgi:ferric-dicitrate binding protein FerR (iron transport regulator)
MGVIAVLILALLAWFFWLRDGTQIHATQEGETLPLVLEEGLEVVLNESSSLEFFPAEDRLLLHGEAYFRIEPRPARPLLIETPHTQVQVLGTAFNLRARSRELFTEVEMEHGSVVFVDKNSRDSTVLNALQRGRCWKDGKGMTVEPASHGSAHYWRTGQARFLHQPLQLVLREMERHYDLEVEAADHLLNCPVTITFSGSRSSDILRILERILDAEATPAGTKGYLLRGGACPREE